MSQSAWGRGSRYHLAALGGASQRPPRQPESPARLLARQGSRRQREGQRPIPTPLSWGFGDEPPENEEALVALVALVARTPPNAVELPCLVSLPRAQSRPRARPGSSGGSVCVLRALRFFSFCGCGVGLQWGSCFKSPDMDGEQGDAINIFALPPFPLRWTSLLHSHFSRRPPPSALDASPPPRKPHS